MPLPVTLLAVCALKGARPRLRTVLVGMMLGVIVFIAVGSPVFGFPWDGGVG